MKWEYNKRKQDREMKENYRLLLDRGYLFERKKQRELNEGEIGKEREREMIDN